VYLLTEAALDRPPPDERVYVMVDVDPPSSYSFKGRNLPEFISLGGRKIALSFLLFGFR